MGRPIPHHGDEQESTIIHEPDNYLKPEMDWLGEHSEELEDIEVWIEEWASFAPIYCDVVAEGPRKMYILNGTFLGYSLEFDNGRLYDSITQDDIDELNENGWELYIYNDVCIYLPESKR